MPAFTNICRQCERSFTAKHLSSRYCGAACRQQAYRNRLHKVRLKELLDEFHAQKLNEPEPLSVPFQIDDGDVQQLLDLSAKVKQGR